MRKSRVQNWQIDTLIHACEVLLQSNRELVDAVVSLQRRVADLEYQVNMPVKMP
jgi:hypothetical protein